MAKAYLNYGSKGGQARPISGREKEMLPNNAGGYGFQLDDWERLERFLILGSESGTYYVTLHRREMVNGH
jgi:60 kDa SS-A/Ro ribonucleoprotein